MAPCSTIGFSSCRLPPSLSRPLSLRRGSLSSHRRVGDSPPGLRSGEHAPPSGKPLRWAVRPAVLTDRESLTQDRGADDDEVFSWTKHWYPVVTLDRLEESQGQGYSSGVPEVQKMSILGRDIVVWKDSEGKWRAVEDRCAHRLAALSLGSVQEDGTIACRYHGWCFNGRGECTHIPQAPDATSEATACGSSRSKVQAFPTFECHGLLWVWPDDSPSAWEDSAADEPIVGDTCRDDVQWDWADIPVTYATLTENSQDPLHVLYVHAGAFFGPELCLPSGHFKRTSDVTANEGFTFEYGSFFDGDPCRAAYRVFKPPCLTFLTRECYDGSVRCAEIQSVPTRPGNSRFFIRFEILSAGAPAAGGGKSGRRMLGAGAVEAVKKLPQTLAKLAMSVVPAYVRRGLQHANPRGLVQDVLTQHSEDVGLARSSGSFQSETYLPTPSDIGVSNFRQWYDKFGGGEPAWFGGGSDGEAVLKHTRADLFNRWERHTKMCPTCRKSVKFFDRLEAILTKVAVASLVLAVFMAMFRSPNPRFAIVAASVAGLALLGRFEAQQQRGKFLSTIPNTGIPEFSPWRTW